ncbi:hypothetical protein LAZ67_9000971 [Cordylochernes scorpioides]|uniref:Uncharacterized protein n=1 Tax=Cordylochernes scorpioides TaxID=51811 RepID=A0ABY6KUR2_9ARAC|nr:hypothetical protein LAZ67_9000971 [Cordylochernes scorpioides]
MILDSVWKTDIDFLIPPSERVVMLSFISTAVNESAWGRRELVGPSVPPSSRFQVEEVPSVSPEFLNYAFALLVYAVRYPSVYWNASKSFGLLFSFQLILNGFQQLLAFAGFAVLYKIHIVGPRETLLKYSPFLLNVSGTVTLLIIYTIVVNLSGSVVYMYGYQKYREWQRKYLQKNHITWMKTSGEFWGYYPHVTAFIVLLSLATTSAPLMYDLSIVYCGSLDGAVLATVTGTICHMLLWIIFWFFLTLKQSWQFQGAPCSNNNILANGNITKVPNEIELPGIKGKEAPLLIIENGKTFQVQETASKMAILNLAKKSMGQKLVPSPGEDEDVYWLKPKTLNSKDGKSAAETERLLKSKNNKKASGQKHKVTFEESLQKLSPNKKDKSKSKSPKQNGKSKGKNSKYEDLSDSDGDYATLRDLPLSNDDHTHKSLCPLGTAEELEAITRGIDDGDYELLLEHKPIHVSEDGKTPIIVCDTIPESGCGAGSDSSSGVHSSSSIAGDKRCSSLENLLIQPRTRWKSMSLQRNVEPPIVPPHGLEADLDPNDSTLVIWRHTYDQNILRLAKNGPDPFGRSTNMRMTSFTEHPDFGNSQHAPVMSPKQTELRQSILNSLKPFSQIQRAGSTKPESEADSANYSNTSSGDSDKSHS